MWYVYIIRNLVNGKLYVGKGASVIDRWNDHKKVARGGREKYPTKYHLLHRAISKYGIDNFTISTVSSYELEQQAFDCERSHIATLKLEGHKLYNLTDGGEGASGHRVSDEHKEKIRKANTGRKPTEETRAKMSLAQMGNTKNLGRKQSEEHKKKNSLSKLGKKASDETRRKMSLAQIGNTKNLGKRLSDETKQKLSLARVGTHPSDETKKKMFRSQLGLRAGEKNGQAKIDWDKVNEIRKLYSEGSSCTDISKMEFGISRTQINSICKNKTWKV